MKSLINNRLNFTRVVNNIVKQVKPHILTSWLITVRNILIIAIALVNLIILTRIFDKAAYGLISYASNALGLLIIFNLTGTSIPLTSGVSKGYHGTYYYLLKKIIPFSILGMVVTALCGLYFFQKTNTYQMGIILLLVAPLFLLKPLGYSKEFLAAVGQYDLFLKKDLFASLIIFAGSLIAALKTNSIVWYVVTNNFLISIYRIYLFLLSRKYAQNNNVQDNALKNVFIYSGINLLFLLVSRGDKILVGSFISLSVLADYSIAYTMFSMFNGFIKQILTPSLMKLSGKTIIGNYNSINKNIKTLLLFSLICTMLYGLCVYFLGRFILPERYKPGIIYAYYLGFSVFFSPIIALYYSLLKYQLLSKLIIKSDSFLKLLKLCGFVILLPVLGIKGIILAIIITDVISILIYRLMISNYLKKQHIIK